MQATTISNLLTGSATNVAAPSLVPFDPASSSSSFPAVFQAVLKGAGSSGKFPPAGKAQDSAREPAATAATASHFPVFQAPMTVAPAPVYFPLLPEQVSPATQERDIAELEPSETGAAGVQDPFPVQGTSGLARNGAQAGATAQAAADSAGALAPAATNSVPTNAAQNNRPRKFSPGAAKIPQNNNNVSEAAPNSTSAVSQNSGTWRGPFPPALAAQAGSPIASSVPAITVSDPPAFTAGQTLQVPSTSAATSISPESSPAQVQDAPASPVSWNPSPVQRSAAAQPPSAERNIPASGLEPPNGETAQEVSAGVRLLNLNALIPAGAATRVSATVFSPAEMTDQRQSNLQATSGTLPSPVDALADSAAHQAAPVALGRGGSEDFQAHETNPAGSPVSTVPVRTQSRDFLEAYSIGRSNPVADQLQEAVLAGTDEMRSAESFPQGATNEFQFPVARPLPDSSGEPQSNPRTENNSQVLFSRDANFWAQLPSTPEITPPVSSLPVPIASIAGNGAAAQGPAAALNPAASKAVANLHMDTDDASTSAKGPSATQNPDAIGAAPRQAPIADAASAPIPDFVPPAAASLATAQQDLAAISARANALPTQGPSAVPSSNSQSPPRNAPSAPIGKAAPTALADLSLLNLQAASSAAAATKNSAADNSQLSTNPELLSGSQPLAALPPSLPEAEAHSAAISAAIGASSFKLHDNLQPPTANLASTARDATLPARAKPQGSSNDSQGNDSNSKPNHALSAASDGTDDKAVVQSIQTTPANPPNVQPTATVAAPVATASAPVTNSTGQPATQAGLPASADPTSAPSLPAPAQNVGVVSSAHIVEQPGKPKFALRCKRIRWAGSNCERILPAIRLARRFPSNITTRRWP